MKGYLKIMTILLIAIACMSFVAARPDSAGHPPEGFAYGGIPYGSMSGNVAEYYRMKEASAAIAPHHVVAQPIVQYPNYYNYYHH